MAAIRPVRTIDEYADIIDLPPHEPSTRPRMTLYDRAAQFSPYAALVGYGDMVAETARLTDDQQLLDEQQQEQLNEKLQQIQQAIEQGHAPAVELSCFVPDARKAGGSYRMIIGRVRRIDPIAGTIIMTDRKEVLIERINEIYCETIGAVN